MKATPQEAEKQWKRSADDYFSEHSRSTGNVFYLKGISDFKAAYRKTLEQEITKTTMEHDFYDGMKAGLKLSLGLLDTVTPLNSDLENPTE